MNDDEYNEFAAARARANEAATEYRAEQQNPDAIQGELTLPYGFLGSTTDYPAEQLRVEALRVAESVGARLGHVAGEIVDSAEAFVAFLNEQGPPAKTEPYKESWQGNAPKPGLRYKVMIRAKSTKPLDPSDESMERMREFLVETLGFDVIDSFELEWDK